MHTIADRLTLLSVWFGVRVSLAPDGQHLDVIGPADAVDAVTPMLKRHRADFVAHLRGRLQPRGGIASFPVSR